MRYDKLPVDLFRKNRERFMQTMKPNSIAIFQANDELPRNGDCFFPFRQNSDLFYLSGLDQEACVLVLFPDCPKGSSFKEVVFTKKTNDYIKVWDGYKYTQEDVTEISGVKRVYWLEDMATVLNELILLAENVYLNSNENDRAAAAIDERNLRLGKELQQKYAFHEFERAQPILKKLRMLKSEAEIDVMRKACHITEQAFRSVLAHTKPGMKEYEVEAHIIYEFTRHGSSGHAYSPIVAGGANACILHYNDNDQELQAGDVLLMDFGAEYGNYASDLSRTIPVGGRYSDRQKAVYNAVLRVKKAAEQLLRPGITLDSYHKEVGRLMESELIDLGLLNKKEVKNQNPKAPLYKKYFMHGTSHHIGIDVHDLCDRYVELEAGMVFTCEPGIYIPEEGIGIRLEDDLVITDGAPINLMGSIPIEAEEIETLMNKG